MDLKSKQGSSTQDPSVTAHSKNSDDDQGSNLYAGDDILQSDEREGKEDKDDSWIIAVDIYR